MKQIIKNTAIILSVAASLFVTGCDDVIFAEIREEVKLEDAQIQGDVRSIVRFNDKLWVQNGNIFSKDIHIEGTTDYTKEHNWKKVTKPENTTRQHYRYVNKLAADDNYLYAQLTRIDYNDDDDGENEPTNSSIFCTTDGITWDTLTIETVENFTPGYVKLFCTNNDSDNKAYARVYTYDATKAGYVYKLYELNGTSAAEVTTPDYLNGTTTIGSIQSCTRFGGKTIFTKENAIITDGTTIWNSNSNYIYYRTDPLTEGTKGTDMDATILSMDYTSDYIVAGTYDGINYCVLNSDGTTGASSYLYNSESTLSAYYQVYAVYVTDHSLTSDANIVYGTTTFTDSSSSTSAQQSNCGLWSYYQYRPNGNSGKWNKE